MRAVKSVLSFRHGPRGSAVSHLDDPTYGEVLAKSQGSTQENWLRMHRRRRDVHLALCGVGPFMLVSVLAVVVLVAVVTPAKAATRTWEGDDNDIWSKDLNWVSNNIAGSGDLAVFDDNNGVSTAGSC